MTMRRRIHGVGATAARDLAGVSVLIVGDILHSRVARSNIHLLKLLGAKVTLVGPSTLMPESKLFDADVNLDFDDALSENPDVVMMLRIQSERMSGNFFPSEREYVHNWGLTSERFARLNPKTLVMHPGPMIRGLEICSEAADSPQSTIVEQVANGISVRMAVLYSLISGERSLDV
jgi:aspartate carbamoyltransferase catalytic subunit